MKLIDPSNNKYEVTERELHDMFANAFNDLEEGAHILEVELAPSPELAANNVDKEALRVLLLRANAVLQAVNEIDCAIHDIMEYSCACFGEPTNEVQDEN